MEVAVVAMAKSPISRSTRLFSLAETGVQVLADMTAGHNLIDADTLACDWKTQTGLAQLVVPLDLEAAMEGKGGLFHCSRRVTLDKYGYRLLYRHQPHQKEVLFAMNCSAM